MSKPALASVHRFPVRAPLFVHSRHFHGAKYLPPDPDCFTSAPNPRENCALPFAFDSEFLDNPDPLGLEPYEGRRGVTVQIQGVAEPDGLILAHPDQAAYARATGRGLRHPVIQGPASFVDWLRIRGHDVHLERCEPDDMPEGIKTMILVPYAHFALADMWAIPVAPEFREDLIQLYIKRRMEKKRRLVAKTGHFQAARLPWLITINGHTWRVALKPVDSAGVLGNVAYAELAVNVGLELPAKDLITRNGPDAEIKRMHEVYFEAPERFDRYALGDLLVPEILRRAHRLWGQLYGALGIGEFYVQPNLTVGASVARLLEAKLASTLGMAPDMSKDDRREFVRRTTGEATSATLSRLVQQRKPGGLLAKVDGGRCRNASPTITVARGALVDIDIAGAYARQQAVTPFCIGIPVILAFGNGRDRGKLNGAPTLAEFLHKYRNQLVDRAWYARVSTSKQLDFDQDVVPSWIDWGLTTERLTLDEQIRLDIRQNVNSGEMRYFARELHNATLTSDLVEVLQAAMSPRQWADFASKVRIRACAFYDARAEVSLECFREMLSHDAVGTQMTYTRGGVHIRADHAWTRVTVGELASDHARSLRKQYPKGSPQNTLYKLVSNTSYGDLVSRYFEVATTVAGSNITAGVRATMYLCEKALCLAGTITDGHVFDLNAVLHPKVKGRQVKFAKEHLPRLYTHSNRAIYLADIGHVAPLAGRRISIDADNGEPVLTVEHKDGTRETWRGNDARAWVDRTAMEHVRRLFPDVAILREHSFEMKSFVRASAFHGSANYRFEQLDGKTKIAMRAYESRKTHHGFSLDESGNLVAVPDYDDETPAHRVMRHIAENPRAVPRFPPFLKARQLGTGEFRNRKKWHVSNLEPGDTYHVIGRPSLFSITQFTFQTRAQYEHWRRFVARLKRQSGESIERYFSNPDGTVDFERMVAEVDRAVREGALIDRNTFDPGHRNRDPHPLAVRYTQAQKAMRARVEERSGITDYNMLADISSLYGEGQE